MLRKSNPRLENYTQACRRATRELQREHHKFLGIKDVVKAMLMWIETTDERARKNLAQRLDLP